MTGRLRYLLAAAFVALFWILPEADREHVAFLQTKAWLTAKADKDAPKKPFESAQVGDKLPPLAVVADHQGQRERWTMEYQRVAREWARTNGVTIDESLQAMELQIWIGDTGFLSKFKAAGQPPRDTQLPRRKQEKDGPPPEDGYLPNRWSLLPAFLAILLAILTGKVIPALFLGCFAGAWQYKDSLFGGVGHLVGDTIWARVLTDSFNVEIMLFVVFLFMCVGIMTRAGGIQGMVALIRSHAKGPISTQICAFVTGILIFFDDYTNCVITGTTMRPLTDRNRVSREKLSYIVDSTAAPIAGISIFSTWVAYEVSMFAPQLPEVTDETGAVYTQDAGFSVFIQTLPFRFYCFLTLVMVLGSILMRREFGSMLAAERRAVHEGKPVADDANPMISEEFDSLEPKPGTNCLARNALVPIGLLVAFTLVLIFYFGHTGAVEAGKDLDVGLFSRIKIYLGYANSQRALCWASGVAMLVAAGMVFFQRILTPKEIWVSAYKAAKALGFAVVILILAWSIGKICIDVGTNQFLTAAFGKTFQPWLLPAVMFSLSALVAFCTGTSYGTMAILLPNVVVLAHTLGQVGDFNIGGPAMMMLTIGAVLEGSIFGDHCSPISDTTVLSSVSTGSDHLHHVRTQAPYALVVMIVSMVCGYLPLAYFGPSTLVILLSWTAGILVILGWLRFVGKSPDVAVAGPAT